MQMISIKRIIMKRSLLYLINLILLSSCGISNKNSSNTIYTSFYPIYDFTKKIVGDKINVENLTPYGVEPHDYEPTTLDVRNMYDSKGIFINGLGLENYYESLPKEIKNKTYVVTDNIEIMKINNVIDPHVWLSIPNAIKEMENILDEVIKLDAENKDFYTSNFNNQKNNFLNLYNDYSNKLKDVKNKSIVVSHAAFGYLCKDYSLEQIYVDGLSPNKEPNAKDIERIIKTIKEYKISTIFYEELVSPEISKKIANETGAKIEVLDPLEGLSKEESKNNDYLSIMKKNYDKILEACNDTL